MYAARYGPFTFLNYQGTPRVAQAIWRTRRRSGVQGTIYEFCGYDAQPFTMQVTADTTTWGFGHILAQNWQAYVAYDPQQLEVGGYVYPGYFKLLEVGQPDNRAILVGLGGTTSPNPATSIVQATIVLQQIVLGSF